MRSASKIRQDSTASALDFLAGGGEMGARMRALDWSATALGPVEDWPQSLRSAASICIGSRFPIVLYWGPRRVVLYNDAYAEILGGKHPWALGRPCQEVWSEIWDVIAPMLDGVAATGQATWSQDQLLRLERRGYPEECYFSFSFSAVRGEDGRVEGIFTAVIENTGRVLSERRLALLRDLGARNTAARTARQACQLTAEALAGSPDVTFALAYLDGALQAATPDAESVRAGAAPALVKELPISGGTLVLGISAQRPFDEQYAAFLDLVAAQLANAVGSARAYEEEKQRAEALADLDRAKTVFFSNVSHEFRTPLTLMLAPLEDALTDAAHVLPPAQCERVELARRSGLRLQKLVNTLLDFSRIEAGRAHACYAPTDLGTLTADLASSFRSAIERAGVNFVVDCPPLAEPAYVDRDMWEKIVLNLLSNAFKFTFEGEIAVSLRRTQSRIELSVRDTGTGIAAVEQPHVFTRFHRVDGARSRTHEGTGIGLALVQELVKLHGGAVRVESVEGRGSTFTVAIPEGKAHLPADRIGADRALAATSLGAETFVGEALRWLPDTVSPAAGMALPTACIEKAARSGPRARILWADDNADMREYVRRLLAASYEVEAVPDGAAALAAIRTRRPDLVLADIMMPRLDGLGLVRALRADPQTSTLPVILLSARVGEESRIDGYGAGASDYLYKPFGARELLARVTAQLEIARVRLEAEDALREVDRRKDEFLATLSHELRNPLAPLRNGLHALRLKSDGANSTGSLLEIMERQVNHLVRLVDDLLELSRITRGVLELRRERVELSTIVRNALETSEPLVQAGRHRLDVSLPGETLWLEGDPVRLSQVLSNLLNNAAKYTPDAGTIAISTRRDGDVALISVRDNGIGIAPEAFSRIFEMFSREGPEGTRGQGGLGIGLSLSRRLAEMHGGTIEAKSEGIGRGSEFIVRLPLVHAAVDAGASPRVTCTMPSMRALVVDDNQDAATSLGMVLSMLGADVTTAYDGPAAIDAFAATNPAVVLLDIGMPGMDGYEVARALRRRFPERRPAIVALTGWGQEDDRRRAREAGIDHHLTKPAEMDVLRELLAEIARQDKASPIGPAR
ncbi:MAG TPA: ATP-binding protein [Burkholderiales bacterium]|nr:ATP-binding protein [Burkholderiales bacterium]